MRKDEERQTREGDDAIEDLGAASERTQGTFMPLAYESLTIKDYFDQP